MTDALMRKIGEAAEEYVSRNNLTDETWYEGGPLASVAEEAFEAGAQAMLRLLDERMEVPKEKRQELVSALWKLGLNCNYVVDDSSRLDLIMALIINCENRDDWKKQAHQARLELDFLKKNDTSQLRIAELEEIVGKLREGLRVSILWGESMLGRISAEERDNVNPRSLNQARAALAETAETAGKGER